MLTIAGQIGKALDATPRTLPQLKIRDLVTRTEALADDSMTWTARTQDIQAAATILPDFEQEVALYNGSTRIFLGHCSDPRDTMHGTRVTVLGPWWWLRRTALSQAGTASDRPTMEFPQQTVKANLIAILTRAITKGVPIRIGTIADTLTVPKTQISEGSFADALADQLKYIADGVGWWDYSSGLPAFNLTRRAGALDTTYTIRSTGNELTEIGELQPMGEQTATRVELTYYTRGSGGQPQQAVQTAGTASAGHVQTVAISGPERDTFVPREETDFVNVRTVEANTTIGLLRQHLMDLLPEVQASRAWYGRPNSSDVILADGEQLQTYSALPNGGTNFFIPQPPLIFLDAETGAAVSRVGKYLLMRNDPPEWLDLPGMQRVVIKGRLYVLVAGTSAKSPYGTGDKIESTPPPAWAQAFPWTLQQSLSRTGDPPPAWSTTTSFPQPAFYNRHQNQIWALDFEITAILTTASYPTQATVYKPSGFDYLAPPSGMAAALLAMQSWTPWKGSIRRKGAACDGSPLMHRKFNIGGLRAAHETMGALPRAVTYDWRERTVSIELGAPARHDSGSLVQRFRQPAQTNIQYT